VRRLLSLDAAAPTVIGAETAVIHPSSALVRGGTIPLKARLNCCLKRCGLANACGIGAVQAKKTPCVTVLDGVIKRNAL